jgi:hypothetical protein
MSNTPPTAAPMAAFTPVERPGEVMVFAVGLVDAVATVEDEIVESDVVDESVVEVAALPTDVVDTAANC